MMKAKKYDWKDSNLALFGSDTEKQVKKASAESEPAWKGAGQKVGIKIWRIVKFKVTDWPKTDYGKFYNGDSYIILKTYKEPDADELKYDVHFWIGQYSTQDEYATAAYKTVELDTFLDDKPIQHREVEGHESDLFKTYFPFLTMMDGGADTGFRHVAPTEYKPRLMHFHGQRKNIEVKQRPLSRKYLDSSDVFILDLGLTIYQWNGSTCNKDEKFKAVQYCQAIKSERGKAKVETLDEREISQTHVFFDSLPDVELEEDSEDETDAGFTSSTFKLSTESGKLEFSLVSEGPPKKTFLDSNDVFIIDTGKECFVWVGSGTDDEERKNAMTYAHNYLMKTKHPLISVSCMNEGQETKQFNDLF